MILSQIMSLYQYDIALQTIYLNTRNSVLICCFKMKSPVTECGMGNSQWGHELAQASRFVICHVN